MTQRYLVMFKRKMEELRTTPIELFEIAYIAVFNKQGNIIPDYCVYIQDAILPKYVHTWLDQVQ